MPYPLSDTTVSAEVITEAPLFVGARVGIEAPWRLRGSIAAGVVPDPYVDLLNRTATRFGWYDDTTGALIDAAIQDSFVLRAHLGHRPWARHGFFYGADTTLLLLGGGLTGQDVVVAATGEDAGGDVVDWTASATVLLVGGELGWEWVIGDHLLLRLHAGAAFTVFAASEVAPEDESERPRVASASESLGDEASAWLDNELRTYVHTPTLGLGVGWRF